MDNILVIGDSWSSAIESDTGNNAGWPSILGIDPNLRQAVAGSTAQQWANDFDGRLSRAINTPANNVIMSLMGNDILGIVQSGSLSFVSMAVAFQSMQSVTQHFSERTQLIILLYTDPFGEARQDVKVAVPMLNAAIVSACPKTAIIFHTSDFLTSSDFNGTDIHPTRAGHEKIASFIQHIIH
jgi:hypothetical protein